MKNIPSVDLSDFTSGNSARKQNFVTALGDAYREVGFVTVKNHSINESLIEELYREVKAFFNLPDDSKLKYEKNRKIE